MRGIMKNFLLLGLLALFVSTGAFAGSVNLAWNPVSDSDLSGYRIYYGTAPGTYSTSIDAKNVTAFTVTGLDQATRYYFAVKAYDTGGLESLGYSNEVAGLPRPVVSSVSPASGEQGATLTLTITGESFDTSPTVEFSGTGVSVTAVRRTSFTQLSVDIKVDLAAAAGARDVTVMNPDRSFGTKAGAFTVTANAAPTVSSVSPAAGATNVSVSVKPTVVFSEAMSASSITASTVRLLDSNNVAVAQAAGSPALGADGKTVTITPSANLAYSKIYHVSVTGGASGAKDASGKEMASDYNQSPGWTTGAEPDTTAPTVSSTSPADGANNVSVAVKPVVTFSEPVAAASATSSTILLLDSAGNPVAQAAGSPALSADRKQATITPAASLNSKATYKIQVIGGSSGVKDDAGNPLASTYTQTNGFTTENLAPSNVGNHRRTDVK